VLLYVDDLLIIGHQSAVKDINRQLAGRFEVVMLGAVRHFLGMVVTRDREQRTVALGQAGYVERVLARFGLAGCHGVSTPLDPKVKLVPFDKEQDIGLILRSTGVLLEGFAGWQMRPGQI